MITDKVASIRMDALEQRIAKLESESEPLGVTCPKCRAFGFRFDSYSPRTALGGKSLQMMKCRFCGFTEEKMAS
jgi:predicted Zn-ribbon and HTH transcriptional regulator